MKGWWIEVYNPIEMEATERPLAFLVGPGRAFQGGSTCVEFSGVGVKAELADVQPWGVGAVLAPRSLLCDLGKPLESANLIFFVRRKSLLLCISEDET